MRFWNIPIGTEVKSITDFKADVEDVAFSANGKSISAVSRGSDLRIWDTTTFQVTQTLTGQGGFGYGLGFRLDGKILATTSSYESVYFWDLATGKSTQTYFGQTFANAERLVFSSDGKWFVTSLNFAGPNLHNASTGKNVGKFDGTTQFELQNSPGVDIDPTSSFVAAAVGVDAGSEVRLWELATRKPIRALKPTTDKTEILTSVAFRPDGQELAVGSNKNVIYVYSCR